MATARKKNLFGFGKKRPTTKRSALSVGAALKAAHAAGRSAGDTGAFSSWLDSKGLWDRSKFLKSRLERAFAQGVEGEPLSISGEASGRQQLADLVNKPVKYKGYTITYTPEGYTSTFDRGSMYDTELDAKRAVDAYKRRNSRNDKAHKVSRRLRAAEVPIDPRQTVKLRELLSKGKRSNPEHEAAEASQSFHGREPNKVIEVRDEVHEHEWYWQQGALAQLKVKTLTGYHADFNFNGYKDNGTDRIPETEGADIVRLWCAEDGKQLYVIGGDQELDLAAFDMGGDKWVRDLMVIGTVNEVTYQTRKGFDKFELTNYFHKLGEESKEKPILLYDYMNKSLLIAGGQYHTEDVGIVN